MSYESREYCAYEWEERNNVIYKTLEKSDYDQINRYLEVGDRKLGILVNFRSKYLKPIRVIRSYS